jgi:hypothetical protein
MLICEMTLLSARGSSISFVYVLKLSHFGSPPFIVFRLGHMNETVALQALRVCLDSDSQHPRLLRLRAEPLHSLALRWLAGEDIFSLELRPLCIFIAELRMSLSTDRPGEAQHAKVHQSIRTAHNHTAHFSSFAMRKPEIETICKEPDQLANFAYCVSVAHYERQCTKALGLEGHPVLRGSSQDDQLNIRQRFHRSTLHSQVIYHADGYSLYTLAPPVIELGPPGGKGRPPLSAATDNGDLGGEGPPRPSIDTSAPAPGASPASSSGAPIGGGLGALHHEDVIALAESAETLAIRSAGAEAADELVAPDADDDDRGPQVVAAEDLGGEPSGGDERVTATSKSAPIGLTLSVDSSFDHLLQKYLREHFRDVFSKSDQVHQFSITLPSLTRMDVVFGDATPLRTLMSILAPTAAAETEPDIAFSEHPDGRRDLYFRVVRWSPELGKRVVLENERGFASDSIAIAVRRVLKRDSESGVVLESESVSLGGAFMSQPLILGLSSFPIDILKTVIAYTCDDDLLYGLKDDVAAICPQRNSRLMQRLLKDLCESQASGGVVLEFDSEDGSDLQMLVSVLLDAELVRMPTQTNAKYGLTAKGIASITVGVQLKDPRSICVARPDTPVEDCNVWELIEQLSMANWTKKWHPKRTPLPAPYDPKAVAPTTIWYLRVGANSIRHSYLLALALGTQVVQHFGTSKSYKELMGEAPAPRKVKGVCFGVGIDEEDFDALDDAMARKVLKRQRRGGKPKTAEGAKKRRCVRAASVHADRSSSAPDGEVSSEPESSSEAPPATPAAPSPPKPKPPAEGSSTPEGFSGVGAQPGTPEAPQQPVEVPSPQTSSDSSSKSSSSSSSDSNSSSSSDASSDDGRDAEAALGDDDDVDDVPIVRAPAARPKVRRKFMWGGYAFASIHPKGDVQTGWGVKCGKHYNREGKPSICKKDISFNAAIPKEEALMRLKMWIILGQTLIKADDPQCRTKHRDLDFKTIDLWTAEDIEALNPCG